jgi:hypothetical protein
MTVPELVELSRWFGQRYRWILFSSPVPTSERGSGTMHFRIYSALYSTVARRI